MTTTSPVVGIVSTARLPATGAGSALGPLSIGALLVSAGSVIVLISRRREDLDEVGV